MDFPVNTNRVNGDKPGEVSPVAPGDASGVLPLIKDLSCLSEGLTNIALMEDEKAFAGPGNAEETMIRHCWAQPTAFTAIAAGVQTGVWSHVAKYAGPFNAADVAKELKIDSSLLWEKSRFIRHFAAMRYLKDLAPNTYESTSFTKTLALHFMSDGYPIIAGQCMASLDQFHEYLEKNGLKEPNREVADGFDDQPNSTLLVDTGGSTGHDVEVFLHKHPQAPGRLIVQDLPFVVDSIQNLDNRIGVWDTTYIEAHWKATSPDMMMMMMMMMIMLVSARERTLELWKALIEKAGLKIIRVYSATSSAESLIECELAWGLLELYPH
ncbi:unnamed protein product [Clonostachys rosea f. rosea IK726]|uniref:Uncharacterized protein n=1 Tax=Clonostachys rosea f. rosea IK726 TaxID=1349383 RepID=A0ACA9UFD9_BIOOC|nr:unnamed protein product [Clonostachys rosea f. rosea IK726]